MGNKYLILAYAFVWAIFLLYVWSLSRRQARVERELDELRKKAGERSPADSSPS